MSIKYEDAMSVMQEIFEDLGDDLDLEDDTLSPDAKVVDMGMESISLVYLVSELQQHFGLGDALFRKVRGEDRLLVDMTVHDIIQSVVDLGSARVAS